MIFPLIWILTHCRGPYNTWDILNLPLFLMNVIPQGWLTQLLLPNKQQPPAVNKRSGWFIQGFHITSSVSDTVGGCGGKKKNWPATPPHMVTGVLLNVHSHGEETRVKPTERFSFLSLILIMHHLVHDISSLVSSFSILSSLSGSSS